jgi:hypothetical protein
MPKSKRVPQTQHLNILIKASGESDRIRESHSRDLYVEPGVINREKAPHRSRDYGDINWPAGSAHKVVRVLRLHAEQDWFD